MKLSRSWLGEFVDLTATDRDYAEAMTLSGSKVEGTEVLGGELTRIVAGKITALERHPDSDHLWVCQVDAGGAPLSIVTGAQNLAVGDLVPVALDGATLAGGLEIKSGVLRGVPSQGMLCSLKELGLTTHNFPYAIEDGIFVLSHDPDLAPDLRPGQDIAPLLGLDDHVVEFEITPNRPDCLSMIGLARESAVTYGAPLRLHEPQVKGAGGSVAEHLDIEIEDPALCPRYTARMVKNVKIGPSPLWMRKRLHACGVRPINNIVDITNYVMLEHGQPMHAFDFACVTGGTIVVRTARPGETLQTLDGNDRALTPSMLCICDAEKPVGVAGVMGGANSEIIGDTAMVVFESANFSGVSVRQTAAALGMRTDASSRFEKGLDPLGTLPAVQRACELVELLGCGEVQDGVLDVIAADQRPTELDLRPDRINRLLGTDLPAAEMAEILIRLGFVLDGERVRVPSWRGDVEHYSDLAEEVARFYGYDKIPVTLMRGETTRGGLSEKQRAERLAGLLCRGMGCSEIITYSFIGPSDYDRIAMPPNDPRRNSVTILNPLGEDRSVMRTTALPSLLESLGRNYSYRNAAARLYELATVYTPVPEQALADERLVLTLGAYGAGEDFFTLKGMVEGLLAGLRVQGARFSACGDDPSYHPGRCAVLLVAGQELGRLGQVHPLVAERYGMDGAVFAAELEFARLLPHCTGEILYRPLPRFPAVTRDIAVVCDEAVTVAALEEAIAQGASLLLRQAEFFDVYTGAPIPAGKKSVAFALSLRADTRTLTDADADAEVAAILAHLEQALGAVLR